MIPSDLPGGIFSFFLDLWNIINNNFVNLVSWFTENSFSDIADNWIYKLLNFLSLGKLSFLEQLDISFLALFFGTGLTLYISLSVVKWLIGIIM